MRNRDSLEFPNGVTVRFGGDVPDVEVDGARVEIPQKYEAQMKQGKIPVRYILTLSGYDVKCDKGNKEIVISTQA